jgi:hypothetical protein
MFISPMSVCSILKHSGALMSYKVDAAEGGFQHLAEVDDLFRLKGADVQVVNVDVGEDLEEGRPCPPWTGLAGLGAECCQAEHRRAVGETNGHQVALVGVFVYLLHVRVDGAAGLGDAGAVGHGQVLLRFAGLHGDTPQACPSVSWNGT